MIHINFKPKDNFLRNRLKAVQEGMRQAIDNDIYYFSNENEEKLFRNYDVYKNYIFDLYCEDDEGVNDGELDQENLEKLIEILSYFDEILIREISIIVDKFIDDQVINKIIEIFLISSEVEVISMCLKVFCNFTYMINDISQFYIPVVAHKIIESINLTNTKISKYAGQALGNLLLDREFYSEIISDKYNLYDEYQLFKEETYQKMDDPELNTEIYINVLQILYALLFNGYDPDKLICNFEYAQTLLIQSQTLSKFKDCDIATVALRIFSLSLSENSYFEDEQIQQVLSLFNEDFIAQLGLMIGQEENTDFIKSIIDRLIYYKKDITPIISDSLLCVLRIPHAIQSKARLNLLVIIEKLTYDGIFDPDFDYIDRITEIAEKGNFDEKKISLLIICDIAEQNFYKIENYEDVFPTLIAFLLNDDRSIFISILKTIHDLIYGSEQFIGYILSHEDDMQILHDIAFDSEIQNILQCKKLISDINLKMEEVLQNSEES